LAPGMSVLKCNPNAFKLNLTMQIDDQLYGTAYPILLYPSTLTKSTDHQEAHPTLHVALDLVKDQCTLPFCYLAALLTIGIFQRMVWCSSSTFPSFFKKCRSRLTKISFLPRLISQSL
jgi:hypothetical protein